VGDTGAASAALGLCLAIYDQTHGHARAPLALVISTSEAGLVGCVAVQAAGEAPTMFLRMEG
jgi:3-oxoacyl-[acyl-carrier-protein] synthase-1